jgi:hypothetical protein
VGDWPRLVNLRRAARAFIFDTGEATNTTITLFNQSLGPELLLVWQIGSLQGAQQNLSISHQQLQPLANVAKTQPIVPSDAPPPGILSSGDQPTFYTPDYVFQMNDAPIGWPATFPFAVIPPQWAMVIQYAFGGEASLGVTIWWEAILEKYFDRVHTYSQLELDLIVQSGS